MLYALCKRALSLSPIRLVLKAVLLFLYMGWVRVRVSRVRVRGGSEGKFHMANSYEKSGKYRL